MGGFSIPFNFVEVVDPIEISREGWERILSSPREFKIYLDKYMWLAGRTRRERLLLAGIRLMPFGLGREPILISLWTSEYIGFYEVEDLLRKEGPRALLNIVGELPESIEFGQREFRYLLVPPAEEFTRFTSWVFKLGRRAPIIFGWPKVPHPPPEQVERIVKKMELEGIRQPEKYKPHPAYRPTSLSFYLKLFIVVWRNALLKSYGLSIRKSGEKVLYTAKVHEADTTPLPEPCKEIEGIRPPSVGSGGVDKTLEEEAIDLLFNLTEW
ncbi:MAG: hypothetical protein GXO18_03545 [Aquificae bacterium]|nr:hypothetical protein [Aquificota bacterium]